MNVVFFKECGIAYKSPNVKIIGGKQANNQSWPAYAFIQISYSFDLILKNGTTVFNQSSNYECSGTLINRRTSNICLKLNKYIIKFVLINFILKVLTAAHCILEEFSYKLDNRSYKIKVKTNKYFPKLESMYRVHLGTQHLYLDLGIEMKVEKIIKVNKF